MRRWRHMGRRLGQLGRGGVRFGAYLLNDTFTTNRTAGAVDGTAAEPGPGRRSIIDSANRLSLSGGNAVFSTAAANDPRVAYAPFAVMPGRTLILELTPGDTSLTIGMGATSSATNVSNVFQFNPSGVISGLLSGSVALATYSAGVRYKACLINRVPGYFWFLWDEAEAKWKLLALSSNFGTPGQVLAPVFGARGASTLSAHSFSVPAARWLPVPLVSDGFSAWATSDGLGHAEGVAGGLGSGGNAKAWTSAVGTWGASGGVAAATALVAGRAIATVDCGKANMLISANMVVPSGTLSIVVRWTDENNFVMLRRTPTNLQLVKTVAGATTTVSDNASTYVAGAEVRLICEGTKFRMFYNNAAVSTEQTIADAAVQTATVVGLRSGDTACTADNFLAYARGSGGEFAALDAF